MSISEERENSRRVPSNIKILLLLFTILLFFVIKIDIEIELKKITPPEKEFGEKCISLIEDRDEIDLNYIKKDIENRDKIANFGINHYCQEIKRLYLNLINNRLINSDYHEYIKINKKIDEITKKFKIIKDDYEIYLLEKIDGKKDTIYRENKEINTSLNAEGISLENLKREKLLFNDLIEHRDYQKLIEYIRINEKLINNEYQNYIKEYPIRKIIQILLFLTPIFITSLFLYRYFLKREKILLAKSSLTMLFAIGLFIIYKILPFLYKIFPKNFFNLVINFFIENNLLFLLNYLIVILLFTIFILIIEKFFID